MPKIIKNLKSEDLLNAILAISSACAIDMFVEDRKNKTIVEVSKAGAARFIAALLAVCACTTKFYHIKGTPVYDITLKCDYDEVTGLFTPERVLIKVI